MKTQLSISSWNVRGLGDKIKDPIYLSLMKSDIKILLETWKGESDELKIEGFYAISKSRKKKKNARWHSGEIIIYIKKSIQKVLYT